MPAGEGTIRESSSRRTPALFCVLCFSIGVLLDHFSEIPFLYWMTAQLTLILVWFLCCRLGSAVASLLVLNGLLISSGGGWHHLYWSVAAVDDVQRFADFEPCPVQLIFEVASPPVLQINHMPAYTAAWPLEDRTRFTADVQHIVLNNTRQPASGRLLISLNGSLEGLKVGDVVQASGMLRHLAPPANPAMFDFARSMRQRGIICSLFCREAAALQVLSDTEHRAVFHPLTVVRNYLRDLFAEYLPEESSSIARALILGERQSLDPDVSDTFRRSGLIHLLSISGLHVGLLGIFCFYLGRMLRLRHFQLKLFVLGGMTVCLLLAEFRAPVFRAWLIGLMIFLSISLDRSVQLPQTLALAAWMVLIVNPAWLFDAGTHLSFLAIIGIISAARWLPQSWKLPAVPELLPGEKGKIEGRRRRIAKRIACYLLYQPFLISLAITVLALPLLAFSFGRVALSSIPATVFGILLLSLVLISLFLMAVSSLIATSMTQLFAGISYQLILLLNALAELAAGSRLQWLSARPPVFVMGLFGLLFLLAFLWRYRLSSRRRLLFLLLWSCLLIGAVQSPLSRLIEGNESLTCRVLSVGHGNAVLVRYPNGKTMLMDGGSMENGAQAARIIVSSLTDMGTDRLDAVLISHTDTDHLNAIPFLMEQVPIREILLNPVGLNPRHPGMRAIVETAFAKQIRMRVLQPQDEIHFDDAVTCLVRQCAHSPAESMQDDNADSLVIELAYAGKRVLFPGDVEGAGQTKLFAEPGGPYDMILAPHHGGKQENHPAFAKWAEADQVIVSTGDLDEASHLREVYPPETKLLFSCEGAIQWECDEDGIIQVMQWDVGQFWKRLE